MQLSDRVPDRCCCWAPQSARPPPPCGRPVRPPRRAIPRRRMGPAWSRPKHRPRVGWLHHGGARRRRAGIRRSGADRPRGPGGRLYYAGDSLGGAVGLQALLDAPDRILAAVLLCTGAKIGDAEGWRERAARVRASGTTVVVNQSAERWFAPGFLEREPQVGSRLLDSLRAADAEGVRLGVRGAGRLRRSLPTGEIAVPVLAVAGAEDFATPADLLGEIADGVQRGIADPGRGGAPGAG